MQSTQKRAWQPRTWSVMCAAVIFVLPLRNSVVYAFAGSTGRRGMGDIIEAGEGFKQGHLGYA